MNITPELFAGIEPGQFGYRILVNGKKQFVQSHMPAVPGNQPMTRAQAEKISALVVSKLQARPGELPTITVEEIAAL